MMARKRKPKVLFVDDDPYGSDYYVKMLKTKKLDVHYVHKVDDALDLASRTNYDGVVIDIMMPKGEFFDELETSGGFRAGIALAIEMSNLQPDAWLIALTNSRAYDVEAWFKQECCAYYCKAEVEPEDFAAIVENILHGVVAMPRIFIVHGHDREALLSLKNYLQNGLRLPEPIILDEQPSLGLTLIEKFEHYAKDTDIVFVLLTPDDFRDPATGDGRARQNVIFEYGYFLGALGRRSGRVFLLYKQGADIPSDFRGVIYVNVTQGIEAAGEQIRRELQGLFP